MINERRSVRAWCAVRYTSARIITLGVTGMASFVNNFFNIYIVSEFDYYIYENRILLDNLGTTFFQCMMRIEK